MRSIQMFPLYKTYTSVEIRLPEFGFLSNIAYCPIATGRPYIKHLHMNTQFDTVTYLALQEGIVGCIVGAVYSNGHLVAEDYDRMLDALAGREIFLETDILKLIKSQAGLRYILDEDDFLTSCCEKITEEWKRPVFAMVCHLLIDGGLSLSSASFLKALKQHLDLKEVKDIIGILSELHKDRTAELLFTV